MLLSRNDRPRVQPGLAHVGQVSAEFGGHGEAISLIMGWATAMGHRSGNEPVPKLFAPLESAAGQHHTAASSHCEVRSRSLRPQPDHPTVFADELPGSGLQQKRDAAVQAALQEASDQSVARCHQPLLHSLHYFGHRHVLRRRDGLEVLLNSEGKEHQRRRPQPLRPFPQFLFLEHLRIQSTAAGHGSLQFRLVVG